MKIIGHRGAAGLALENSLEAIHGAISAGVDGVEIDIRITSDGVLVVNHDRSTKRTGSEEIHIKDVPYKDISHLKLQNGENLPTLLEAIDACKGTPLYVEAKDFRWAHELAQELSTLPSSKIANVRILSLHHPELVSFAKLRPDIKAYAIEHTKPFDVIATAHFHKLHGIALNFWLLNPLTYWLARYYKLDVMVYTVDNLALARFLKYLYPDISITTDMPQKMQSLRNQDK